MKKEAEVVPALYNLLQRSAPPGIFTAIHTALLEVRLTITASVRLYAGDPSRSKRFWSCPGRDRDGFYRLSNREYGKHLLTNLRLDLLISLYLPIISMLVL